MNEMVERLATLLAADCFDGCEDGIARCADPPCSCRAMARKLILAMLEPTQAMEDAAKPGAAVNGLSVTHHQPNTVWIAMIAAALDPSPAAADSRKVSRP